MKILEHIAFTGDDPYPKLDGYDCENVRIVMTSRRTKMDGPIEEIPAIEIQCPCCAGEGVIRATIECEAGHGCEHDVEVDCTTCDGMGWCELRLYEYPDNTYEFVFEGYEDDGREMEMPHWIIAKFNMHRRFADPNQTSLFTFEDEVVEETP